MDSGVLLADKPQGITSHDAVARTRRALGTRKVGHAGTLDPMATGLLVLGVGPATRLLTHLVGLDKEYTATMRLGASTTSDDADGEVTAVADPAAVAAIDDAQIAAGIAALTGPIEQRPNSVSAIRVDGRRAYDLAREGETVELPARPVTIHAFDLIDTRRLDGAIELDVRVECSSGTYIRALARDLGAALGVGGHLTALRRTRVGPFSVDDADLVPSREDAASWRPALMPPAAVAARLFPVIELDADQAADLANGKRLAVEAKDSPLSAAIAPDGRLVGLVAVAQGRTKVVTNFPVEA